VTELSDWALLTAFRHVFDWLFCLSLTGFSAVFFDWFFDWFSGWLSDWFRPIFQ